MAEDSGGKLAQKPSSCVDRQLLEHGKHAFSPGVSDRSKPVSGNSSSEQACNIGHDKSQCTSTQSSNNTPELLRRTCVFALGQALVLHHLFKNASKLRLLRLLSGAVATAILGEVVPRP